jgi:phage gpG-like protein
MTAKEFNQHIEKLEKNFEAFFEAAAPEIVGTIAVEHFKKNFQEEGFFGEKWQEVKRRQNTWTRKGKTVKNPLKGAARTHKILTGGGNLGRSIEVKEAANRRAVVFTNPAVFGSQEPYGRVHNEGLRAGRGAGFVMPKRQFIGVHETLMKAITSGLQKAFNRLVEKRINEIKK